jgi:homoserine dehydrogenase
VVADLVDVTRLQMADPEHRVPHLAFQPEAMADIPVLPMADVRTSFYLRLRVDDRPGVLADLARVLSDAGISVGSMFQQPHGEHQADIIFLTHEAREGDVDQALRVIRDLPFVGSDVTRLRVENIN